MGHHWSSGCPFLRTSGGCFTMPHHSRDASGRRLREIPEKQEMGTSVALPPPDNRGIAMTRACHGRSGRGGLCPQHPRQLRCPSYGARRTNNGATRGSGKAGPHTPRIRHHKVIPHHPLIIGRRVSRGTTLGNTRPEGTPPRPCRAHNGCGPTKRRRYPPESLCLSHGRAHARGHDGGPAYGHMSHGPRSHPKGLHSKAQRSVGQTQGVPDMPRPLSPTLPAAQIRGIAREAPMGPKP